MSARIRRRAILALLVLFGCRERRDEPDEGVTYAAVAPLLARACVGCHGQSADRPLKLDRYDRTLGCDDAGAPLTLPADERAPLVRVLARPDHATLLTDSERALLTAWIRAGAPGAAGTVHPGGVLDPRSGDWHGKLAAADRFAPLRDPEHAHACGRCHDGSPVRPAGVTRALSDAPACTSCHDGAAGVLACDTCHGDDGRAYPPRDGCAFPSAAPADVHAFHAEPSRFRTAPLACATCHPVPGAAVLAGTHANGAVEVAFDVALAGPEARFTPADGTCAVACHARGGTLPMPAWRTPATIDCNSCHLSPPFDHYTGLCSACHREMGPTVSAPMLGPLHVDGVVERGAPPGSCGACHGLGTDPWPRDASHQRHATTTLATPVACTECHQVPAEVSAPGHLDGRVDVRLSGRAAGGHGLLGYDSVRKVCGDVGCHGAALAAPGAPPAWNASALGPSACNLCHGAPPPSPHVAIPTCEGSQCHGDEVRGVGDALRITSEGRTRHVDGTVQTGGL